MKKGQIQNSKEMILIASRMVVHLLIHDCQERFKFYIQDWYTFNYVSAKILVSNQWCTQDSILSCFVVFRIFVCEELSFNIEPMQSDNRAVDFVWNYSHLYVIKLSLHDIFIAKML